MKLAEKQERMKEKLNDELLFHILGLVEVELCKATENYDTFHNYHEGYAVLKEEVDELWDAIKLKQIDTERNSKVKKEAIQVCAMAIRILHDCCKFSKSKDGEYL